MITLFCHARNCLSGNISEIVPRIEHFSEHTIEYFNSTPSVCKKCNHQHLYAVLNGTRTHSFVFHPRQRESIHITFPQLKIICLDCRCRSTQGVTIIYARPNSIYTVPFVLSVLHDKYIDNKTNDELAETYHISKKTISLWSLRFREQTQALSESIIAVLSSEISGSLNEEDWSGDNLLHQPCNAGMQVLKHLDKVLASNFLFLLFEQTGELLCCNKRFAQNSFLLKPPCP